MTYCTRAARGFKMSPDDQNMDKEQRHWGLRSKGQRKIIVQTVNGARGKRQDVCRGFYFKDSGETIETKTEEEKLILPYFFSV